MPSNLTPIEFIQERSEATPGLWNQRFSVISDNLAAVNSNVTFDSAVTLSVTSNLSVGLDLWVQGQVISGQDASITTRTLLSLGTNSNVADYIKFSDTSASRSNYILGSHVGGTADGLNLWDDSAGTMIASFSKQSIRFFQNVVGPVFDIGGALADTLNAATFGTGADSVESRIQAAISQATTDSVARVYVPANMYPYRSGLMSFATNVQMVREGGDWSVYDVWAYGAKGVGHDAAAAQGAVNGAAANKGVVYFPPGTYNIASSITCVGVSDLQIRGPGSNAALISMAASGITLLQFTGVCSGVVVRDLWLGSFVSRAAGASLEIVGTAGVHSDTFLIENVVCQNTPNPIYCQYLDQSNFNNVRVLSSITSCVVGYGVYLNNVISTNFHEFLGNYISHVSFPRDIVVIGDDCDTVVFLDSQALGAIGYGFRMENVGGSTGPRLCRLTNTFSESNTSGGFVIKAARDLHLASCHAAVNGGPGYRVEGGDGIQIYDSLALQNNEDGVIVATTTSVPRGLEIAGCLISNNGQTANNTYDGIAIGSGISGVRVANNRSGNFIITGLANGQRSGISIAASTDYVHAIGNDLQGNVTSGLASTSTGVNNLYLDNSNLTTSSGGTITALAGAIVRNTLLVGTDPGNGGEILRVGGHARINGYVKTEGTNGQIRLDNRTSSGSSQLAIYNQSGTHFHFHNVGSSTDWVLLGATVGSALSLVPASNGSVDLGSINRAWGRLVTGPGTVLKPASTFSSEQSLGWYRSAASTMALSYGTLSVGELYVTGSGISIGNATAGGSLIPAISSTSSLVAAFVVQGSASSFTVVTWAAAQPGDQILTTVMQSGAVSSLSSGLVLHSHCTKAGQIEFRLSNVSTLAQNQSSRTYFFTRISPF